MIRPVTIATFLMACGSGLYLYQSKHEVHMLDRKIEDTVRQTATLREKSRNLATEWTMLNDPNRLRQFSDMYLHLKSIDPKQFTSLADLGNRLPAVPPPAEAEPVAGADDGQPVAAAEPPDTVTAPVEAASLNAASAGLASYGSASGAAAPAEVATGSRLALPVEPVAAMHPVDMKPAPRPAATETLPAHQQAADSRVVEPRAEPRLAHAAEPRQPEWHSAAQPQVDLASVRAPQPPFAPHPTVLPVPRPAPQFAAGRPAPPRQAYAPPPRMFAAVPPPPRRARLPVPTVMPASAPYGGSLLGMAQHGAVSPPRPAPLTYSAD